MNFIKNERKRRRIIKTNYLFHKDDDE